MQETMRAGGAYARRMMNSWICRTAAVALVCIAAPCQAADTRVEIESMLRDMAAACIAGDSAGYMKHVSEADPEFFHEQKYFANDLIKKPAKECAFTIGELKEQEGVALAPFTMEWAMPTGKPRTLTFDAKFVRAEEGWRYAGETWERHEAPGVLVLHDPGLSELADRVVTAFGEVRSHVQDGFNLGDKALASRTQKIKLYGTMKHLQASICLSYSDGLAGWNEPGESIKILTNARSSIGALRPLLAHEFGHVATFELGPTSNKMPWWILEGVAELSAEQWGRKPDGMVKAWAQAGRIAKWDDLADFETVEGKWRGHVYTQGHHMLGFISDQFGRDGRVAWMTAMSNGKTLDEASQEAFKLSFAQLDERWRASLPPVKPADEKAADEKPAAAEDSGKPTSEKADPKSN